MLEEIGDAHGNIVARQPGQVLGRIGLSVQIDQQGTKAFAGTDCRQVTGDARFAHATFLIEYHAPHKTSVHQ
ncbi:hypothetical protein D3C81_1960880 [compost metagenome]